MDTKTCSACHEDKPLDRFNFHNKTKGIRYSECKDCWNAKNRERYQQNKAYYINKASARKKTITEEYGRRIWAYLEAHPCIDCGETDPVVLQFDHVRGKKRFNIAEKAQCGVAWTTLEREIDKCEVRCANCHFRRTAKQMGWHKWRVLSS